MTRRLVSVTLDNLGDLPEPCRGCAFWELDPVSRDQARKAGELPARKEEWVSATLLEWGSCGKILYVDETPVGYVLFAPPAYVPGADAFPTSPASPDAVLLMTIYVHPEASGGGLGRILVQGVAKDLLRRGVRAIEAFGTSELAKPCIVPVGFLLAVGFKTVRPHVRHPRLRLELKTTLSWREDIEGALERLLGSLKPEPTVRPI